MNKLLKLKKFPNTLFVKLLLSFLAIVLLLVSFNFLSFTFFKNSIHDEIINYNNLNLKSTVESYENHLTLIKNAMHALLKSETGLQIHSKSDADEINYYTVKQMTVQIQSSITNQSNLFLENIMLYYKNPDIILEHRSSTVPEKMFTKFYVSENYPFSFWERQFNENFTAMIYPAAPFSVNYPNSVTKLLIPVVVKNQFFHNRYSIALLDASRLFSSLHQSINDNFLILNDRQEPLFATAGIDLRQVPFLDLSEGYVKRNDNYYFYKRGASGLTYVNIIPNQYISSQLFKLNFVLVTLLAASILISLTASIYFSMRIKNPIHKIIRSIQHFQTSVPPLGSNIEEFQFLNEKIRNILKTNQDIHRHLHKNNSLLRNYAFSTKLKKIHSHLWDEKDFHFSDKPFVFILFDLTFKPAYAEQMSIERTRAVYYYREFIDTFIGGEYPGSFTFQIEENQVLSLIFCGDRDVIARSVSGMKKDIFDLDRRFCFFTIALSEIRHHSRELTSAYEQTIRMIKQRRLNGETQIVLEELFPAWSFQLSPQQENEFHTYLASGNNAEMASWLERMFKSLLQKQAGAAQYGEFSVNIVQKVKQTFDSLRLDSQPLDAFTRQLNACYTLEETKLLLGSYVSTATALVKQKKEEHNRITSFVKDYLEIHYADDVSLEQVADKLNITASYLSTYFKENTGMNFSDYLNEIRIQKAKQFLQAPDIKIKDVAEKVGYMNVNSFFRMFKKSTGLTPGEFRRQPHF